MKATEAKLLDFLKKSPQFVIPIYQRTYSWSEQQCRQLWVSMAIYFDPPLANKIDPPFIV
ncbi:GmrSD restriction endonuclease domain-containing protein [Marinobacter salarius]